MTSRSHKLSLVLAALVITALLFAACTPATPPAPPAPTQAPTQPPTQAPTKPPTQAATTAPTPARVRPIKVAIMGPFTGNAASLGVEQLDFARLAVADFNQAMGTSIELVEEDTQLDPAIATTVAQKLAADTDVYVVIGPSGSQEVQASAEIFETAQLAHVSPSATRPSLTQSGYKTFFRVVPNDFVQGPADADLILKTLKAKSVYIIDDQSSYSVGLADIVEAAIKGAGVSVARDSVTQKDTDFSSLVTKIKAAKADVVFFPGQIASQGAQLWNQMREQGVTATLTGGDGFNSPDLTANGANEASYVTNFAVDINTVPDAARVAQSYKVLYGDFTSFGPPTYVAAMVVLEAIDRALKAGTLTRQAVLAEVAKTDMPTSILGVPIKFDANGDVIGAQVYVYQVKDGKFVLLTP